MEKRERKRSAFGQRMAESRAGMKPRKLTQQEVCSALGIAQATLSELETTASGSTHIARFAALYKVDAHWLETGEGAPHPAPAPDNLAFRDLNAFESQLVTLFRQLPDKQQHDVLVVLNDMIPKDGKPSSADPFPLVKRSRVRGISQFSELASSPPPIPPKPATGKR